MNAVVALEQRFDRTPDGAVWTPMVFAYAFWTRYLDVFEHVRIVARVREVPSVPSDWQRVDGLGVSAVAVPHYLGPWQYLLKSRQVQRVVRQSVGPTDAVILRVGSQIAACLEPLLQRTGHPYGVEVVGDPYDMFAPQSLKHPLRPFFRLWFARQLRQQCNQACAAAYVTERALQRRYPCPNYSVGVSDVELPVDAFVPAPRQFSDGKRPLLLVNVGTMAQSYKGQDVLIDALSLCVQAGLDLRLVLIGDGKHRPEFEARAAALGVGQRVCFAGQIPGGAPVRAYLDAADLFVMPSWQEGLPRAMVEAMARALPCIGSAVGGIPELLPEEVLVPPGDAAALAAKIQAVSSTPASLARLSARNLEKANAYREATLTLRRTAFYREVRSRTTAWLGVEHERP